MYTCLCEKILIRIKIKFSYWMTTNCILRCAEVWNAFDRCMGQNWLFNIKFKYICFGLEDKYPYMNVTPSLKPLMLIELYFFVWEKLSLCVHKSKIEHWKYSTFIFVYEKT